MADTAPASTSQAAAPTNTPASSSDLTGTGATGAAGAAASAVDAVLPGVAAPTLVQPRATGVRSLRPVMGKPAPVPSRREAPAVAPKETAASPDAKAATPSAATTAPTEKDSQSSGSPADDKAKPKGDDPKLTKSWADLMDREAAHVERENAHKAAQKELTEAQKQLTADKKAQAEERARIELLKKPGNRVAILRELGVELKDLNDEYLQNVNADPVEAAERAAERKVKELEKAHQDEIKRLADERVKVETEKATKEVNDTYVAMETEFKANHANYPTVRGFDLTKEQVLQVAFAEMGRLPTPSEGAAAMKAAEAFFEKKVRASGWIKKSEIPAAPAPVPAPDIKPNTLTSRGGSVPLATRPSVAGSTWQERLAEGKRLLNITD